MAIFFDSQVTGSSSSTGLFGSLTTLTGVDIGSRTPQSATVEPVLRFTNPDTDTPNNSSLGLIQFWSLDNSSGGRTSGSMAEIDVVTQVNYSGTTDTDMIFKVGDGVVPAAGAGPNTRELLRLHHDGIVKIENDTTQELRNLHITSIRKNQDVSATSAAGRYHTLQAVQQITSSNNSLDFTSAAISASITRGNLVQDVRGDIIGVGSSLNLAGTFSGTHVGGKGIGVDITTSTAGLNSNFESYGIRANIDNANNGTAYGLHITAPDNYFSGNVSGSSTSTGSFGHLLVNGSAVGASSPDATDGSQSLISGSTDSTGSFGRIVLDGHQNPKINFKDNDISLGEDALLGTGNSHNVAIGYRAAAGSTSGYQVAIGYLALSGSGGANNHNVAIGTETLSQNIDSNNYGNTAVGGYALQLGNYRYATAVGYAAAQEYTGTSAIVAIGYNAARAVPDSNFVAIGSNTLNTTGSAANSVAVGISCLQNSNTALGNYALGANALQYNTTGNYNVAIGRVALQDARTASNNIAIGGYGTLMETTTGGSNIAIGTNTMNKNLTGISNIAIGGNAMRYHTDSDYNVAIGINAMQNVSVGTFNVALGYTAGYNTKGDNNVMIGQAAGYSSGPTTVDFNVFIGYYAGRLFVSGSDNVAVGKNAMYQAGKLGTNANDNVAVGENALYNVGGLRNVGIGLSAMSQMTVGNDNVAVGYRAGQLLASGNRTSGSNSVYIGQTTISGTNNSSNEIVIGANAIGKGTNTVVLGDDTITDIYLSEDSRATVYTGTVSASNGDAGLELKPSSRDAILTYTDRGTDRWNIWNDQDLSGENNVLRFDTSLGSSNMVIKQSGEVGIGTTSPAAPLHIVGATMLLADGEADNTTKQGRMGSEHYDVDEEPFYYLYSIVQSGNNQINIGGGTSSGNAATNIQFYTAANSSTTTGTKLFELTDNKISGSSTSTGSFGHLLVGGSEVGGSSPDATDGSQDTISGSAASTGSFGQLETVGDLIVAFPGGSATGFQVDTSVEGHTELKLNNRTIFVNDDIIAIGEDTAPNDLAHQKGGGAGGRGSVYIGNEAGESVDNSDGGAANNTFIGNQAGQDVTSGASNTFLGSNAGGSVTTGNSNVIIGKGSAGETNIDSNVIIGESTGTKLGANGTDADYNIVIGSQVANLRGGNLDYNILMGYRTSRYLGGTTSPSEGGKYNVHIGYEVAGNVITGSYNVAIGYQALENAGGGNSGGYHVTKNIAIGYNVLKEISGQSTAEHNVVLGTDAAGANTSGKNNIVMGYRVAYNNSGDLGSHNILMGTSVGNAINGGDYNVILGRQAGVRLTTANDNILLGQNAGYDKTTGNHIIAIGKNSGRGSGLTLETNASSIFIGSEARSTTEGATNETVIGTNAIGKGSNTVVLGDDNVTDIYLSEDKGATVYGGMFSGSFYQEFLHNFQDDLDTTGHFVPWVGNAESTGNNNANTAYLTPYDMTLQRIIIRPETLTGTDTFNVIVIKQDDGDTTNDVVATATSAGNHANDTAIVINQSDFNTTPSVGALDKVSIKILPASDLSGTIDWYITSIWKVDKIL